MFIQYIFLTAYSMRISIKSAVNLNILGGKNSVPNKSKLQTGSKTQSYVTN